MAYPTTQQRDFQWPGDHYFWLLLLLRNYRGFEFHDVFLHWWPLLIIFWGVIKLYERTSGDTARPNPALRELPLAKFF